LKWVFNGGFAFTAWEYDFIEEKTKEKSKLYTLHEEWFEPFGLESFVKIEVLTSRFDKVVLICYH